MDFMTALQTIIVTTPDAMIEELQLAGMNIAPSNAHILASQ